MNIIYTFSLLLTSQYDFNPPLVYSFAPQAKVVSVIRREASVLLPRVEKPLPVSAPIILFEPPVCVGGNCPLPMQNPPIAPPPISYPQPYYQPRFRFFRR